MFRLLAANCNRHLTQQLTKYHQVPHTQQSGIRDFSAHLKNANKLLRVVERQVSRTVETNGKRVLQTRLLVLGGCSVSLGLGARTYQAFTRQVQCEANRLTGALQKTLQPDERKFDWRRLWSYLKPHLWELLGAFVAALIIAFINVRIPNLLGDLVNILVSYANTYIKDSPHNSFFNSIQFFNDARRPASNLLSLYFLQSGFTFIYIYLLSRVGERLAAKLRQDLFKQIILQDIAFFDANRTGELVNRLTADVQDFKACFKQFFSQGLRSMAQLVGGGVSLFLISPHMAAIALAAVPVVVVFMSYLGRTLRNLSKNSQSQSERATAVCEEALSNMRTVRSSACEYREIELFKQETSEAARLAQELGYGIAIFQGLTNFFLNGLVLTTLFMGGHLMSIERLSPGAFIPFLAASQDVQRSMAQGSILLATMIRGMSAGSRVFEYLQLQPKVDLLGGYEIPQRHLNGEVRFENVTFAYPSRPDHIILKDFNLILRPGQTVALVGASGSGKSTVAALAERFYEPTAGNIKLDGDEIADFSPYWLRGNVFGFVEQQPTLFATTILENIRYGCPDARDKDVYAAAKLSHSHDFIRALPDGYDTNVGERGTQLSGGQRQRIAIARALLKNPKILILDEATSALDATSEAEVQKALDTAVLNRATLVIARQLRTIRNADLIVVMDHGRIVESGKHDELMANRGLYYELVRQDERLNVPTTEQDAPHPTSGNENSFTTNVTRPNLQKGPTVVQTTEQDAPHPTSGNENSFTTNVTRPNLQKGPTVVQTTEQDAPHPTSGNENSFTTNVTRPNLQKGPTVVQKTEQDAQHTTSGIENSFTTNVTRPNLQKGPTVVQTTEQDAPHPTSGNENSFTTNVTRPNLQKGPTVVQTTEQDAPHPTSGNENSFTTNVTRPNLQKGPTVVQKTEQDAQHTTSGIENSFTTNVTRPNLQKGPTVVQTTEQDAPHPTSGNENSFTTNVTRPNLQKGPTVVQKTEQDAQHTTSGIENSFTTNVTRPNLQKGPTVVQKTEQYAQHTTSGIENSFTTNVTRPNLQKGPTVVQTTEQDAPHPTSGNENSFTTNVTRPNLQKGPTVVQKTEQDAQLTASRNESSSTDNGTRSYLQNGFMVAGNVGKWMWHLKDVLPGANVKVQTSEQDAQHNTSGNESSSTENGNRSYLQKGFFVAGNVGKWIWHLKDVLPGANVKVQTSEQDAQHNTSGNESSSTDNGNRSYLQKGFFVAGNVGKWIWHLKDVLPGANVKVQTSEQDAQHNTSGNESSSTENGNRSYLQKGFFVAGNVGKWIWHLKDVLPGANVKVQTSEQDAQHNTSGNESSSTDNGNRSYLQKGFFVAGNVGKWIWHLKDVLPGANVKVQTSEQDAQHNTSGNESSSTDNGNRSYLQKGFMVAGNAGKWMWHLKDLLPGANVNPPNMQKRSTGVQTSEQDAQHNTSGNENTGFK